MKNGSIRRATAFRNAQSPPSGEAGETIAVDPGGATATAGPFPLSRTWNESVNESERVEARSSGVDVGEGDGTRDGGAVTTGDAGTGSVAVAATVGVGVAVDVAISSKSAV